MLAAQDPKTAYALGSAGPGPCQPGPFVVRGIAAGQLGLELEWIPVGNLNMDLEGHEGSLMPLSPESLLQVPASRLCQGLFARHPSTCPNCHQSYWKLTFQDHALEELQGLIAPLVS